MLIQNTSIKLKFNTVINTIYDNKNQHYCFPVLFFFTVYNEITTFIIFFNLLGLKKKKLDDWDFRTYVCTPCVYYILIKEVK